MKKLVIFDLDGTLAESKSAIDAEMAGLLSQLLDLVRVAIISGGDWPQFEQQVLAHLPAGCALPCLSLLPTCGTKFYRYDGTWAALYSEDFTADQKAAIIGALNQALDTSGLRPQHQWGELIEDRGGQITLSVLGQQAPHEAKLVWDPDFEKRRRLKAILEHSLPGFSIRLGGTTSIDVTRPNIDKAYGVAKLQTVLGLTIAEMMFAGDALFAGGNDYPVREAGVRSIGVAGPHETKCVIEAIIACMQSD